MFALLYASEGAPIGLLWWGLPARWRADGMVADEITAITAMVALPWAFKFFWAPIVDVLRTDRWSRRSWIVAMQVLMGLTLLPIGWIDPLTQRSLLVCLLLVHAVAAATQDVSIDALAIEHTTAPERGSINGWMQAGMLVARAIFGGGVLLVGAYLGEKIIFVILPVFVWLTALVVLFAAREHPRDEEADESGPAIERQASIKEFGSHFGHMLRRRSTWLGLGFALVGGAAFEAAGALAGPFFVDHGLTEEQIGLFYTFVSVGCMLAGALIGGRIADRINRLTAVALFLMMIAFTLAGFGWLQLGTESPASSTLIAMYGLLYFEIGLFTAASYALFMDITDPAVGGTQFSAFMGASNLCEAWAAWMAGSIVTRNQGEYGSMFIIMAACSLVGLVFLFGLSRIKSVPPNDESRVRPVPAEC